MPSAEARPINWLTNYDEAVKIAHTTSKPILLFFTGSDWCSWCMKLEEESLNQADFAETAGDKFVFVKLDFPLNRTQPAEIANQNKKLQKQFNVTGFPSIVILDPQQLKPIGTAGYKPGGGKQYGLYLLKIVDGHASYKQKIDNLDKQPISGIELRQLYEQANELKREGDALYIAMIGMDSDQKHFFLLERYRHLAEQGNNHSEAALAIKQQLLAMDPNNQKLIPYQIAMLDFESSCRSDKNHASADVTVSSLVEYVSKYGEKDKENYWRLEMLISQVYFEEGKLSEALQHAKASYNAAPSTVQPEIATAINNISGQVAVK
jgi:protein disulfide-isomerase